MARRTVAGNLGSRRTQDDNFRRPEIKTFTDYRSRDAISRRFALRQQEGLECCRESDIRDGSRRTSAIHRRRLATASAGTLGRPESRADLLCHWASWLGAL